MEELIDYAIIPQSQIQQYEDTITQQNAELKRLQDRPTTSEVKKVELEPENATIENKTPDVSEKPPSEDQNPPQSNKFEAEKKNPTPEPKKEEPPKVQSGDAQTIQKG